MKFSSKTRRIHQQNPTPIRRGLVAAIRSCRADFESLESRTMLSGDWRPIDEVGNNLANVNWGTAGVNLLRLAAPAYANGVNSPSLPRDRSARAISNILNSEADPADLSQDVQTIDQNSVSDFGYAFGQFIDHDIDLTPDGSIPDPIAVAAGDAIGPNPLPFMRSQTDPSTGASTSNPLQQVTDVTAYLDLSQVYGSDQATADALRTFIGGKLKTSPGNMLPYDNSTYFTADQLAALNEGLGGEQNAGSLPTSELFATGDIRGNENLELSTLETLFVRNHNLLAHQLQKDHPLWSDEHLYQEARKLNIAQYQNIVYTEWLPAIYGETALPSYTGYKARVNPDIANEFSTVAFRFGHSMVSPGIERQDNDGLPIASASAAGSSIPLSEDFFDPDLLNPAGVVDPITGQTSSDIGPILKGEADGNGQAVDLMAINSIRNLLFGNFGAGGQDLMALDIQRGRDHGIPNYNAMRVAMGLAPVTSFSQITANVQVQKELARAYPGGVNTIDAFEGGLAEDHVPGSDVGPLFQKIMTNQFQRLRDGDRYFYLNETFNREEQNLLREGSTLTQVIKANSTAANLQPDVFYFKASISGNVSLDMNSAMGNSATASLGGITVELEDTDGDLLARTSTNRQGNYIFTQLSSLPTYSQNAPGVSAAGYYRIIVVPPSGLFQTSANPSSILISQGDSNVSGINFSFGLAINGALI